MIAKQHFKLHFEPDSWVLYEEHNKSYKRAKWQDIYTCKGIKRLHYNTAKWKHYIIIDIDNENIYKYREQKLPEPNFILHNKEKEGGHLFYVLDRGIFEKNGFYLNQWKEVFEGFTLVSGGDKKHKGYVGKFINSSHFKYEQIEPESYDISFLHSFIRRNPSNNQGFNPSKTLEAYKTTPYKNKKAFKSFKALDIIQVGERNNFIFDKTRKYAYLQVLIKNKKAFENTVYLYATELNKSLLTPQEPSEVKATARSIIKYCLKNKEKIEEYKQDTKNRGIMELAADLHIKEKQRLGAKYTAEQKKNKTIFKLRLSLIEMRARELKINISNLSKYSKISRPTILKYKEFLKLT